MTSETKSLTSFSFDVWHGMVILCVNLLYYFFRFFFGWDNIYKVY